MLKQAIPYIRFSSFKQSEGNSYQRQKESIDRWLAAHPEYVRSNLVFEDLAKSGFSSDERKKYKQASGMIKIQEAIKAGLIRKGDCILIEALDRATRRNMVDAWDLITPILKAGVDILTIDDGVKYTGDSLNGSHIFLLVAKIQAAYGYSKLLSERVSESYDIRRKEAKEGKQVKRNVPLWLNTDGTIKPEVAGAVKECFDLYVQGCGVHSIAVQIRRKNIEGLEKLSGPTISSWLKNKATIGIWANAEAQDEKDREEIDGCYPAVIEKERFYLVQRLMMERTAKPVRTGRNNFLSGLVVCGHCNSTMIVHNQYGKPNSFRCLSHHRLKELGCSNNKSIPYNTILYVFLMSAFSGLQRSLQKQTLTHSEKRKLIVDEQLSVVGRNISNLVKLAMGLDDIEEIQSQIATLKAERDALVLELAQIEKSEVVETELKAVLIEEQRLLVDNPVVLNAMLKSAEYKITADKDGVIVGSEDDRSYYKYMGVQRNVKSNTTNYYKLHLIHKATGRTWLCKISPSVVTDVTKLPLLDTEQNKDNDWLSARYSSVLMGQPVEIK